MTEAGVYRYQLNGELVAIDERWQREQSGDNVYRVTSTRQAGETTIEVDAQLSTGRVTGFEVSWRQAGRDQVDARYGLSEEGVLVSRRIGSEENALEDLSLSVAAPLLFPLLRVFNGPLIARLLEAGGQGEVVLPFIADPAQGGRLLAPLVSTRRARLLEGDCELDVAGSTVRCRRCEYLGDQYGPGTEFWLGETDMLLRYRWRQSEQQFWDIWLEPGTRT